MCGIVGCLKLANGVDWVTEQTNSIHYRGPDSQIVKSITPDLVMGVARLAMTDPHPRSNQPMIDAETGNALSFNGEIYNYQTLKEDLIRQGCNFKTNSDTEVILYAYKEWGTACFQKFNGMFALAILDKANQKIILARDHAGIKPLYYSFQNNQLIFASEIRAFKALKPEWEENKDWKKYFLLFFRYSNADSSEFVSLLIFL
mgnify:CR=1 FL=1